MVPATDSAYKTSARWGAIAIGLLGCLAELGCTQLGSLKQDKTPLLGTVSWSKSKTTPDADSDLYAQSQRPGLPQAREALASAKAAKNRERAKKLEKPIPSEDSTKLALSPASPEESETGAPTRPPMVALEAPVSLSRRPGELASNDPADEPPPIEGRPRLKPARGEHPIDSRTATATATSPAPVDPSPNELVTASRARLDGLQSYQVTLNRQERVGETLQEPEEVLLSIRRDPKSVRLEWPSGPHKGREVIYLANEDDGGSMHINAADSLLPVPPLKMPVDSPMVLRNARHPITEAGFDTIIGNLEKTLEATAVGDPSRGTLAYGGLENPGPLAKSCHKLTRVTPSGETWHVYIDPETQLPAMVEAAAQNGDLLERYVFSALRVDLPELASADAFDPARRWSGSKGGLFQRLARSSSAASAATTTTR